MFTLMLIPLVGTLLLTACAMHRHHGRHRAHRGADEDDRGHDRVPPAWGPESWRTTTFRAWTTDIMLWLRTCPYTPPQQCAAIIRRLTGAAREAARSISADEIENGGYLTGQYYDPVSYLLAGLELRFGNLDEEQRQMAANGLHAFRRHQGESTDELLSRYSSFEIEQGLKATLHKVWNKTQTNFSGQLA